jgi:hypothetical protein
MAEIDENLATLSDIRKYFEYESAGTFRQEWTALDKESQIQLRKGLKDGSLTY